MKPTLRIDRLTLRDSSDNLVSPGDYYLVGCLRSADNSIPAYSAIVLKCPYCGGDMASVPGHRIEKRNGWWRKLWGYPARITVTPMLQCPYNPSHKFLVKKNKVVAV